MFSERREWIMIVSISCPGRTCIQTDPVIASLGDMSSSIPNTPQYNQPTLSSAIDRLAGTQCYSRCLSSNIVLNFLSRCHEVLSPPYYHTRVRAKSFSGRKPTGIGVLASKILVGVFSPFSLRTHTVCLAGRVIRWGGANAGYYLST